MKHKLITLFLGSTLLLTSCVDLLKDPYFLSPETLEYDEVGMTASGDGLYAELWGGNYGFNTRVASLSWGGDDIITGSLTKGRNRTTDELRIEGSSADATTMYNTMYGVIQTANTMIEGIKKSTDVSEEKQKPFLGEAYFMRALAYFYLVRYFTDVPAITNPKSTEDIYGNTGIGIVRAPAADIYDKLIIPDLKLAEEYLPGIPRRTNATPCKNVARVCLADVYLTLAGWPMKRGSEYYTLAANKAKEVIESGSTEKKYKLVDKYADLWKEATKADDIEHMFVLAHSVLYKKASNYGVSYMAVEESNGWSDILGDSAFYEKYPNDTRKAFIYKTSVKIGILNKNWKQLQMRSPMINKYRDYGVSTPQSEGITPIYRYPDVLFIYAEASNRAEGKPNTLAYSCINDIRKRANDNVSNDLPLGLNEEEFNQAVFDEYGWEFCAEFKRWAQLVRTERVWEYNQQNPRVRASLEKFGTTKEDRTHYLFPLPPAEVELCGWSNNTGY